jgi:hypothetical protein
MYLNGLKKSKKCMATFNISLQIRRQNAFKKAYIKAKVH